MVRAFGAFLGIIIGGLVAAKMPKSFVEREPHVIIYSGAFFGFVFAEVIIGLVVAGIILSSVLAMSRVWGELEPAVMDGIKSLRDGNPGRRIEAPASKPVIQPEEREPTRAEDDEERARAALDRITAEVEAQAERFNYSRELVEHEINHRFRQWRKQFGLSLIHI